MNTNKIPESTLLHGLAMVVALACGAWGPIEVAFLSLFAPFAVAFAFGYERPVRKSAGRILVMPTPPRAENRAA